MAEKLNDLAPLIAVLLLGGFFTIETFIPYLTKFENRGRHARRNLVIVVLAFALNGACAFWLVAWLEIIRAHGFGVLHWSGAGPWVAALMSPVLLDLCNYPYHILTHKVPALWRFHRVHYSDHELDATSALRFHPLEVIVQTAWQTFTVAVIGASFAGYVIYGTLLLVLVIVQHVNVRFPVALEKPLGWVFVTPAWHRVHHADEPHYTDSHYADIFSFWDRIFGTARRVEAQELRCGLKEFRGDEHHTVWGMLATPFRDIPRTSDDGGRKDRH